MANLLDLGLLEPWTIKALDELLEDQTEQDVDWRRFEIVEGALIVRPQPPLLHSFISSQLIFGGLGLDPLPGYRTMSAYRVDLGDSTRVPDGLVVDRSIFDSDSTSIAGSDVLLVVEIESPATITADRVTKPAQYAAAGIPFFWRVEADPLRVLVHRLDDGAYVPMGAWVAGETVRINEPFVVEFEISKLLPR